MNTTPIAATADMIAAVRKVNAAERLSAMRVAERVFFECMKSPNFIEEFGSEPARHDAAGQAAAAEVAYRFA